jgi:hypothetical protein
MQFQLSTCNGREEKSLYGLLQVCLRITQGHHLFPFFTIVLATSLDTVGTVPICSSEKQNFYQETAIPVRIIFGSWIRIRIKVKIQKL